MPCACLLDLLLAHEGTRADASAVPPPSSPPLPSLSPPSLPPSPAPRQLFVSLLTTTTAASYEFSLYFYLGLTVLSVVFEYVWVEVVYKSFPILAREEGERQARLTADKARKVAEGRRSARQVWATTKEDARQMGRDWADFARQPVFLSPSFSCAAAPAPLRC